MAACRRTNVREPRPRSSVLVLCVRGNFRALQICHSNHSNPYLTSLVLVITPPELEGIKLRLSQSYFHRPSPRRHSYRRIIDMISWCFRERAAR